MVHITIYTEAPIAMHQATPNPKVSTGELAKDQKGLHGPLWKIVIDVLKHVLADKIPVDGNAGEDRICALQDGDDFGFEGAKMGRTAILHLWKAGTWQAKMDS